VCRQCLSALTAALDAAPHDARETSLTRSRDLQVRPHRRAKVTCKQPKLHKGEVARVLLPRQVPTQTVVGTRRRRQRCGWEDRGRWYTTGQRLAGAGENLRSQVVAVRPQPRKGPIRSGEGNGGEGPRKSQNSVCYSQRSRRAARGAAPRPEISRLHEVMPVPRTNGGRAGGEGESQYV